MGGGGGTGSKELHGPALGPTETGQPCQRIDTHSWYGPYPEGTKVPQTLEITGQPLLSDEKGQLVRPLL